VHRRDIVDGRKEYEDALDRIRSLQQALALAVLQTGEWSRDSLRLSQQIDHYVVLVQRHWARHPEDAPSSLSCSDEVQGANTSW
jgi:hypothetical protein